MDWVKFSQLVENLVQFTARVNRPDLEDRFGVFITNVWPLPRKFRGTVYEKCVVLYWNAKDFEKSYVESHADLYGCVRLHWDELLHHFAAYNIHVSVANSRWKCALSLPLPGESPHWTDSIVGPISTRCLDTGKVALKPPVAFF